MLSLYYIILQELLQISCAILKEIINKRALKGKVLYKCTIHGADFWKMSDKVNDYLLFYLKKSGN